MNDMNDMRQERVENKVKEIICDMIECAEACPYSYPEQFLSPDEAPNSFAIMDDLSPKSRQLHKQLKNCLKLRYLLQNHRNSMQDVNCQATTKNEAYIENNSPLKEMKDNFYIRTNIIDYNKNNKTFSRKRHLEMSQHDKFHIVSHIPSSLMSKLPSILVPLITHRIDSSLLLPATQDERANAEVMSTSVKSAKTLSRQAMAASHLYLELLSHCGTSGTSSVGLIDASILSGIAALIRRWGVELRGREPKAKNKNGARSKNCKSSKRTNKTQNVDDSKDLINIVHGETDRYMSHENMVVTNDEDEVIINDFLSDEQLIYEGLQICHALSIPLHLPQFLNWSSDSKEAIIESAVQALVLSCSLNQGLAIGIISDDANLTDPISETCQNAVSSLTNGLKQCVKIFVTNHLFDEKSDYENYHEFVKTNKRITPSRGIRNTVQTNKLIIFILREFYPLLCCKEELPNGQIGKMAVYEKLKSLLTSITRILSSETDSMGDQDENIALRSRKKKMQQLNSSQKVTFTPLISMSERTPTQKKSVRLSVDSSHSKSSIYNPSEPKLKDNTPRSCRSKSPFRVSNVGVNVKYSTRTWTHPRPLLGSLVGMMQKLSTTLGLEKTPARSRITKLLMNLCTELPLLEQLFFFQFVGKLSCSKNSCHRLFASELIGQILLEERAILDRKTSMKKKLMEESSNIKNMLLKELLERMRDKTSAVRIRAILSFSELLKNYPLRYPELRYHGSEKIDDEEFKLAMSLFLIFEYAVQSLQKIALNDEKANVRKAAVSGLMNLYSFGFWAFEKPEACKPFIACKDVECLCQLSHDESVTTRIASAEALTKILQSSYLRVCSSNFVTTVEESWAKSVIPMILDANSSNAAKIIEMFDIIVMSPIVYVAKNNDVILKQKVESAWNILYFISCQGKENEITRSLHVMLANIFEDTRMLQSTIIQSLLTEATKKATLAIGFDIENDDFDSKISISDSRNIDKEISLVQDTNAIKQGFGAWNLLHAMSCCKSTALDKSKISDTKCSLATLMKKCSMSASFLLPSYVRLYNMSSVNDIEVRVGKIIYTTIQICLGTIEKLCHSIPLQHALKLFEILKDQIVLLTIPLELIDSAIKALVSLMESISSVQNPQKCIFHARQACIDWINETYNNCELQIEAFLSTIENCVTNKHKEKNIKKLERAIYLSGELSLIGFHLDEEQNMFTVKNRSSTKNPNTLRGLHIEPHSKLKQLIQTMLPPNLPKINGSTNAHKTPATARAIAFASVGKFCLRDETLAKESINIFSREIQDKEEESVYCASVKSNALIVLGDLCIRYTNLVDLHLPVIAACLQSGVKFSNVRSIGGSTIVRKNAILLLSSLLLQDYIKWRGLLFFRFCVATTDEDNNVKKTAETTLCGPLLTKNPKLFLNNFVETLFVLNGCKAHQIYKAAAKNGDNGNGIAVGFEGINLTGERGRSRRFQIYEMMLSNLSKESKLCVVARLVKEVLEGALETQSDLKVACVQLSHNDHLQVSLRQRHENAMNVIIDTFAVLTSPLANIGYAVKSNDESERNGLTDTNMSTTEQIAVAKGRLLSNIKLKHLIETIVPILCRLKTVLETNRSPLLRYLMIYMIDVFKSNKKEMKNCLAGNPTLLLELEYDAKNTGREKVYQELKTS